MSTNTPRTLANFLKSQVLRSDYVLIDEPTPVRTRFPYEHKLEILHTLCMRNGYRTVSDCEKIRRDLYTQECDAGCPPPLLLTLAYLPGNVACLPESVNPLDEREAIARLRLAQAMAAPHIAYRLSSLNWSACRYWLHLPDDIHVLLVERDSALLAA